jgi:hypothetical protein
MPTYKKRADPYCVTPERIEELKVLGYTVEHLAVEHGVKFKGQFMWTHSDGRFQGDVECFSLGGSWFQASNDAFDRVSKYVCEPLPVVSPERIEELKLAGFYVERIGNEHGPKYKGRFMPRHINDHYGDHEDTATANESWLMCHVKEEGVRLAWEERTKSKTKGSK